MEFITKCFAIAVLIAVGIVLVAILTRIISKIATKTYFEEKEKTHEIKEIKRRTAREDKKEDSPERR